ncbi:hypothetical protein D1007_18902 [Hordeum vulgare]|nr:hypothetical protein D1007_18902 [Hordeum vulgare]
MREEGLNDSSIPEECRTHVSAVLKSIQSVDSGLKEAFDVLLAGIKMWIGAARCSTNSAKENYAQDSLIHRISLDEALTTYNRNPPSPLKVSNVRNVHEPLKGKRTTRVNTSVLQTAANEALQHEEITFTRNKVPHILGTPGTIQKQSAGNYVGWITPEILRGFFTTTNRVQHSPEEDLLQEEEADEDRDDVSIMWEGTHQHNDEDDDDEDEPITVLKLEYKHEFTTFGQHVRTHNDDAVDHDDPEDDHYNHVPPLEQFQTNTLRHHNHTGLPPCPPATTQNRAQRSPTAPINIATTAPAAAETSATLQPTRVPRSEVNDRHKSSSLLPP